MMMKKALGAAASAVLVIGASTMGATAAQAAEPVYNVKLSAYAKPGTDAGPALVRAAKAVQAKSGWQGGTIFVDGQYLMNTTIQLDEVVGAATPNNNQKVWNKVTLVGSGVGASKLKRTANGPMFRMYRTDITHDPTKWYSGTYLSNVGYKDMGFEYAPGVTGYVWELGSGAITSGQWHGIRVDHYGNGGIMYVGRGTTGKGGGQYHSNSWRDVTLEMHSKTNPYIPMRFASAGHYINGNLFDKVWAHHHLNDKAPFFVFRPSGSGKTASDSGRYTNTSFRSITGEQNLGGLIHMWGASGVDLTAISEWDGDCPGYASSIIGFNNNSSTKTNGVTISGSGQLAYNYAPARNDSRTVWVAPGATNVVSNGTPINRPIPVSGSKTCK